MTPTDTTGRLRLIGSRLTDLAAVFDFDDDDDDDADAVFLIGDVFFLNSGSKDGSSFDSAEDDNDVNDRSVIFLNPLSSCL